MPIDQQYFNELEIIMIRSFACIRNWNGLYSRANKLIQEFKVEWILVYYVISNIEISLQSAIDNEQAFVEKLEIDVRGQLTPLTSNGKIDTFNIEIGEIRKSDSADLITKGYRHLWLNLKECGKSEYNSFPKSLHMAKSLGLIDQFTSFVACQNVINCIKDDVEAVIGYALSIIFPDLKCNFIYV
ncbi:hypothetical protein RhiirA5_352997 [Rhizophagus irregularis]|uniref:Uncharacterized protein n=1 Tax=Rhizophagus irregularis TaxID=588596 RepID=A0A2N0Q003_9GLOM|nr:hypothetical protein RhiirA5_352997 [Rhizophagus irregularis]